jgi:hypothetical protein
MWVAAQSACSCYFRNTVKLIYVLDSPFNSLLMGVLCGTLIISAVGRYDADI